jgi:hypothetical protein
VTIHWSSAALARSIGSTDPEDLEAAAALMSDGDYVLRFSNGSDPYDEDPVMDFTDAQTEIDRLVSTYLPQQSPNNSSAGGPSIRSGHQAAGRGSKPRRPR